MRLGLSTYLPFVVYLSSILVYLGMLLYRRDLGLYFLVALLPLQNIIEKMYPFPFGKDIVDIFVVSLLFLSLGKSSENDSTDLASLSPTKTILFYVLSTYMFLWVGSLVNNLSLPLSLDDERLRNWKNHMILPALFIITLRIIQERRQIIMLLCGMLLSMLSVSFYFYRNFGHTGGHFQEERRWSAAFTYLGPNEMGAFWAEYSLIILGILLLCRRSVWRWPLLALLGLNVYGLAYSFSRGAYIAFLVGFAFVALAGKSAKGLGILVLFLSLWSSVVPQSVVERVYMTGTDEGNFDDSGEGRLARWRHGVDLFLKNPLGYGFETVQFLGFRGASGDLSSGGDPHNRYVEFLVEMGVVGFALFVYLFYLAFRSGWRLYIDGNDGVMKGLGLGFAGTVVATMVANSFGDRWTYVMLGAFYWVLWALVVRGNLLAQMAKHKELGSR